MLLLLHYPPSPMTIASASTIEIAHIIPPFSTSFTSSPPLPPPHTYLHLLTPPFCSIGLGMNLLLRADYVFLWGNELIMHSCGVLFFVTSLPAPRHSLLSFFYSFSFLSSSSGSFRALSFSLSPFSTPSRATYFASPS